MTISTPEAEKIREITNELKQAGLWKEEIPSWVTAYEEKLVQDEQGFLEWLQFIYLPNKLQRHGINSYSSQQLIAPQARLFLGQDLDKGKLLRLLVELDSL